MKTHMEGMIPLRSNLRVDVDGELGLLCGVFIAIGVAVVMHQKQ